MRFFGRNSRTAEDRFADEVIALAHRAGIKAQRSDGFTLRLEPPGGSPVVMNLGNIFLEAQSLSGADRTARLNTAVLAMIPPPRPQTWTEAAPKLMPAVRAVSWLTAGGGIVPVNRPFLPALRLLCAIDAEHAITYATEDDLANWGIRPDAAFTTATANLEKRTVEVGRVGRIAILMGPDGYTSSWLAAPEKLRRIAADVGHEVIAVAASRDTLVLADATDVDATVKVMREELKTYEEAPRQLSPVPYRIGPSGLEAWNPPMDHPARPLIERAHRVFLNVEYGYQKSMLEAQFAKTGDDVFVASYALMQRPDGSVYSWAAWSKQVTNALVPRTDVLFLGDLQDKAGSFWVTWDEAIRIAGDSLQNEPDLDPPRWRYRGWPPPPVVEQLRKVALPRPATGR